MHVALRIAYDGTRFGGLARQPGGNTVEDALIAGLLQEGLVVGSLRVGSRTDAGVSALENVVKAEIERPHLEGIVPSVQARLPDGLWLTGAAAVAPSWNPRHADARTYQYLAPQDGEDERVLQAACKAFVGTHDFTAFARLEDRDPVRAVTAMQVVGSGAFWCFEVTAPGFLWNQVRRMVGACLAVGAGKATTEDIQAALATGGSRNAFGPAAAEGLVLAAVRYEPPLSWQAEAGEVPRGRVLTALQAADVRRRVAHSLSASSADP